jgi:hypothetical protein
MTTSKGGRGREGTMEKGGLMAYREIWMRKVYI